jgi:hypothetical protein
VFITENVQNVANHACFVTVQVVAVVSVVDAHSGDYLMYWVVMRYIILLQQPWI